jgi:hypothetical protein
VCACVRVCVCVLCVVCCVCACACACVFERLYTIASQQLCVHACLWTFAGRCVATSRTVDLTLNPVWNQYFFLPIKHLSGATLEIECYDKDKLKKEHVPKRIFS